MFTNTRLSLTQSAFLLVIFAYTNLIQAQITSPSSRPSKAMVLIPEGIFTMGSDIGPSDEKPKHEVFVKSFLMDVLPITNAEFAEFLNSKGLRNLRGETFHPQTKGKIERWHQTLKNCVLLEHYYQPEKLEQSVGEFVAYYNHQRYHERLSNLTPADVYFGRGESILEERRRIKEQTIQSRRIQHQLETV